MTSVLGIDPGGKGGHTGIVLVDYSDTEPAVLVASWAVPEEVWGFMDWYDEHREPLFTDIVNTVVCEHFVNRNIRGSDLTPCFVEGAVRAVTYSMGLPITLQPASGKNTGVPDTAMARAGFSKKDFGGDHHGDRWEALRHVLLWLKKTRHVPSCERMFPDD